MYVNLLIFKMSLLTLFMGVELMGQTMVNENGGSPNWFLASKTLSTHKGASIYTFCCTKKGF